MRKLFFFCSVALLFSSCDFLWKEHVSGNGRIVTQERKLNSFNQVEVYGSMNVHLRQDAANTVKIETDENLIQYIDVYTDGQTLVVREKDGYDLDPTRELIVYVSAPVLRDVSVSGSGDIIGDNVISGSEPLKVDVSGSGNINMGVNLQKIDARISGSGTVVLKGVAKEFSASVSGSGDVRCFELVTENAHLDLSGSADAQVTANRTLEVNISGSAEVEYRGNAAVQQSVSGSGSVRKVG